MKHIFFKIFYCLLFFCFIKVSAQNKFEHGYPKVHLANKKYDYNSMSLEINFRQELYYIIENFIEIIDNKNLSESESVDLIKSHISTFKGIGDGVYDRFLVLKSTDVEDEEYITSSNIYSSYKKNNLLKYKLFNSLNSNLENKDIDQIIMSLNELKNNLFIEILYSQVLTDNNTIIVNDTLINDSIHKIAIRQFIPIPDNSDFFSIKNKSNYDLKKITEGKELFIENEYIFKNRIINEINYFRPKLVSSELTSEIIQKNIEPVAIVMGKLKYGSVNRKYEGFSYNYEFHHYGQVKFSQDSKNKIESIEKKIPFDDDFVLKFNDGVPVSYNSNKKDINLRDGLIIGNHDSFLNGRAIIFIKDYLSIQKPLCDSDFRITNYLFKNLGSDLKISETSTSRTFFSEYIGKCENICVEAHYWLDSNLETTIKKIMLGDIRFYKFHFTDNHLRWRDRTSYGYWDYNPYPDMNIFFKGIDLHNGSFDKFCEFGFSEEILALSYGLPTKSFYESMHNRNFFQPKALHGDNDLAPVGLNLDNVNHEKNEKIVFSFNNTWSAAATNKLSPNSPYLKKQSAIFFGLSYKNTLSKEYGSFFLNFGDGRPDTVNFIHLKNNNLNDSDFLIINWYPYDYSLENGLKTTLLNENDSIYLERNISNFEKIIYPKPAYDLSKINISSEKLVHLNDLIKCFENFSFKTIAFPFSKKENIENINSKDSDVKTWPSFDPTGWDYNIYEYKLIEDLPFSFKSFNDTLFLDELNTMFSNSDKSRIIGIVKQRKYMTPISLPIDSIFKFTDLSPNLELTDFYNIKTHKIDGQASSVILIDAEQYIDNLLKRVINSHDIQELYSKSNKDDTEKSIIYIYESLNNAKSLYKNKFILRKTPLDPQRS